MLAIYRSVSPSLTSLHIPVIDKSKREDGTFSRDDFTFDKECNLYTCPAGKTLTTTGRLVNDGETLLGTSKNSSRQLPTNLTR
jgi:hypothetical protein